MKKQVNVTELTKEELVTFFSCATYGCGYWTIKIKKNSISINDLDTKQCIEDIWADALLKGGKLVNFEEEREDMWDGYNLMQVILFGDIIYG